MMNLKSVRKRFTASALLAAVGGALASCTVGPNYQRPDLKVPAAYQRSAAPEATPSAEIGNRWWTLFGDPVLTKVADDTVAANLDIRAAMARVDQARESRRAALGNFAPDLNLGASSRRSGNANGVSNQFSLPLTLNYEIDVWGRLRRQYEVYKNSEAASVADLEFVRQSAVAEVVQAYFTIRLSDRQVALLEEALQLYRKQLELTDTKYKAGLALPTDLLQAKTQVNSATNQLIDVRRSRAKQEHAIALLLGRAPSDYSFTRANPALVLPAVPAGLPVNLLARRPDVAESEYRLAAANAQIGLAKANFFPSFTLSSSAGFQSANLSNLLDWEKRVWSFGPSLSLPIFQGGRLTAALAQAKARYEEVMANYRTSVLAALRDVEDQLSELQLLAEKAKSLEETLVSAREYSRLTELQYKQGLTTYLQVIDANQTLLNNELSAAQAESQRLTATVLLIKALGGGWQNPAAPVSK
jgi:multidrug efflux system outer membrane protein